MSDDEIVTLNVPYGVFELKPPTYHGQFKTIFGWPVVLDTAVPLGTIECRGHDGKLLMVIHNVTE